MPGYFIAFEGPDGAGKTTQVALLNDWYASQGLPVTVTRQPGGTKIGRDIRAVLLSTENQELDPVAEAFLFAADRAQHAKEVIKPALARGEIVLTDRYVDSSIAYQGFGRGLGAQFVRDINAKATGDLWPDLTVVLDLPAEMCLRRIAPTRSADRIEQAGIDFYRRARHGLLQCAAEAPSRYLVIDATLAIDDISTSIKEHLSLVRA